MSRGTLTVLGCDGSYTGPGGAGSGYLVRTPAATIWLDAGPGTFARLQEVIDPSTLDALILSHEHPDHWTDLESFAVWARSQDPAEPMRVLAPLGVRERSYFSEDRSLDWQEIEPGSELEVGNVGLAFASTDHGPPTMAVRFTTANGPVDDKALVYSADTGPDWSVRELGQNIGLFLCEATYTKDREGAFRHLSGRQAGLMAAEGGVEDLIVTHRFPTTDAEAVAFEAAEALGRPVFQAAAGLTFEW